MFIVLTTVYRVLSTRYTVVRTMNIFNGKGHYSGPCRPEILGPIFKKFGTNDYVSDMNRQANLEINRCKEWLRMRKIVAVRRLSFYFLPAQRYASAGLCDSDVSVRPSVCRPSHAGIVPSRTKAGSRNVHHLIAPSL